MMFKKEVFRLIKNKLFLFTFVLSVLLFSLMCIIVGANSHEEDLKNYAYKLVEEYDNYEDLELLYNNLLIMPTK